MSDEIREQLSALVDDELSELERPLLLGRLQRDASMRECLGRYQLISEVMRGTENASALGIAGRVQEALANDPVPRAVARSGGGGWWKPVAGGVIAASVALVAVLTVTAVDEPAGRAGPQLAAQDAVSAMQVARQSNDDSRWNRIEPRISKRLSGYLVNHSEYAASRGAQGVMPYARIVGYEPGR